MADKRDPILIVSQIIAMQSFYYASLGAYFVSCHLISGLPLSLDRFFATDRSPDVAAGFAASVAGALLLRTIVEKSRKCLDFAVTLNGLHLLFCLLYSRHWPNAAWWLSTLAILVVMVVLGEYLCSRRELMDIPLVS